MRRFRPRILKNKTKELLDERERDPKHVLRILALESHKKEAAKEYHEAAAPLFAELSASGYPVQSLDLLARSDASKGAVPILVKWLPKITNSRVKESIVRALSVPWAKGSAERELLAEFCKTPSSENQGLKWAIGNALEVLSGDDVFDDIVELVQDNRHGIARQMLVMALGKIKNPRAVNVLISLLDDEDVVGHALIGLRKLNAVEARPHILPLLKHPKAWVRREAKKALNKIDDFA
jgi:HEAT repeats